MKNILKNKGVAIFIIVVLVVLFTAFVMQMFENIEGNMETKVKLEMNHGDIVIALYGDMPVTAGNFKKLVGEGFYDGVIFHRVIKAYVSGPNKEIRKAYCKLLKNIIFDEKEFKVLNWKLHLLCRQQYTYTLKEKNSKVIRSMIYAYLTETDKKKREKLWKKLYEMI